MIEGYPVEAEGDRVDQTSAYVGTVRLFEPHGFERVLQTTGRTGGKPRWLVRRELTLGVAGAKRDGSASRRADMRRFPA